VDPASITELETQLILHAKWEKYQRHYAVLQEKQQSYHELCKKAQEKHQFELVQLQSQCIASSIDIDTTESAIKLYTAHVASWKRINELRQKRPEQEVDLQLETLKKNRDIMERFFTNLEARKNIYACPQCKSSLVIQSQKIQPANLPPLTEADIKKEEEYRTKLPKVIEKYDKNDKI
jgi:hypothetical protein